MPDDSAPASPLRPLTVGGLRLESNLLQAPLAGYSNGPFQWLTWTWGRPGLLATEMISAAALAQNAPGQERYLQKAPGVGPVAYQLWGASPALIGEAVRRVEDAGADVVDLNAGCPVRKVRAAGAGSKLMEDPALIGRMLAAMRAATRLPLTLKIRVGPDAATRNAVEIARLAEGEGVDLLTVHGRHAKEAYQTPCRYDDIARVVASVRIPVVGNGDVRDGPTARAMFERTGAAGVMVGRACMGAPWVFARIRTELTGEAYTPPSVRAMGRVLLAHHDMLADWLGGERAIRHCRKLGAFYSRQFTGARELRGQLNFCRTRDELVALVDRYFQ